MKIKGARFRRGKMGLEKGGTALGENEMQVLERAICIGRRREGANVRRGRGRF